MKHSRVHFSLVIDIVHNIIPVATLAVTYIDLHLLVQKIFCVLYIRNLKAKKKKGGLVQIQLPRSKWITKVSCSVQGSDVLRFYRVVRCITNKISWTTISPLQNIFITALWWAPSYISYSSQCWCKVRTSSMYHVYTKQVVRGIVNKNIC